MKKLIRAYRYATLIDSDGFVGAFVDKTYERS
jgi:hypothetical protein